MSHPVWLESRSGFWDWPNGHRGVCPGRTELYAVHSGFDVQTATRRVGVRHGAYSIPLPQGQRKSSHSIWATLRLGWQVLHLASRS
jgi:hypothetical protein